MANFAELTVQLELQQSAFNKGMADASKQLAKVSSSAKASQKSLSSLESTINTVAAAAGTLASAFGAFKAIEGISKASDQLRNLSGSFTALLGDSNRAADMMQKVFDVVDRTGVPLEAAGAAMQRLTIAMKEMGANNTQIQTVADTFIKLGKVGGSSAEETASALQQLGQALASGSLSGDELKSIRENAPLVAQAIADAMHVSAGELKKLGEEGKLTSDVVANALIAASAKATAAFEKLPQSLEQSLNKMESAATQAAAAFDKTGGITTTLSTTVTFIADTLKRWTTELNETNGLLNSTQIIVQSVSDLAKLFSVAFVTVSFGLEAIIKRTAFWAEQIQLMVNMDWAGVLASSDKFRADLEASAAAADATIKALLAGQALPRPKTGAEEETGGQPVVALPKLKPLPLTGGGKGGGGKSDAEREAEALKKRGEALAASVDPLNAYNQKLAEYTELLNKAAISDVTFARAVEKAKEELTSVGDALTASVDPGFAYELQLKKINQAYRDGQIEVETLIKLEEKLREERDKKTGKEKSKTEDLITDAVTKTSEGIGTFFEDIIKGSLSASEAFAKMVKAIISDLAKLLAEFAAKEAAKFIIKSLFGGATAGGASAGGASANSLMLASMPAANWNAASSLAATPFAGAPTGGGTETVGGVGAGGSPWNVTVNNNAPGVDVTTGTRSDGGLEITVQRVRSLLAQDVARGGNAFSRSLEGAYGLGRGR